MATTAAWAGKALALAMLLFAVANSDWARFEGKAMTERAVAYPLALLVIPAVWWLRDRRDRSRQAGQAGPAGQARPYPGLADLLVTIPFVIDVAGNLLDAYDRISWFDDACHFVNWAFLLGGLAVSLPRALPAAAQLGLVTGLGAASALAWEVMEYYAFIRGGTELDTAYTDTLSDMVLGTVGATLAGLLVLRLRLRQRQRQLHPAPAKTLASG